MLPGSEGRNHCPGASAAGGDQAELVGLGGQDEGPALMTKSLSWAFSHYVRCQDTVPYLKGLLYRLRKHEKMS